MTHKFSPIDEKFALQVYLNENFILYEFFLAFYMKSTIEEKKRKWIDRT